MSATSAPWGLSAWCPVRWPSAHRPNCGRAPERGQYSGKTIKAYYGLCQVKKQTKTNNLLLVFFVLGQRKHAFGKSTDAYHVPGALHICVCQLKPAGTADVTDYVYDNPLSLSETHLVFFTDWTREVNGNMISVITSGSFSLLMFEILWGMWYRLWCAVLHKESSMSLHGAIPIIMALTPWGREPMWGFAVCSVYLFYLYFHELKT